MLTVHAIICLTTIINAQSIDELKVFTAKEGLLSEKIMAPILSEAKGKVKQELEKVINYYGKKEIHPFRTHANGY